MIIKKIKLQKIYILIFIILTINIKTVCAVDIGVSPGVIDFENMLRGGYAERSLLVSITSEEDVFVNVSARGEIKNWLNITDETFNVSRDKPFTLKVIIEPPLDTPNGDYSGYIRLTTGGLGTILQGYVGSVARAAVDVIVNVEIIDFEIRECRAEVFSVNNPEKGDPIEFGLRVINDGNIKLNPLVEVDIWNTDQTQVVNHIDFDEDEVLPTISKNILVSVDSEDLDIGQYWSDVYVRECGASSLLTFDVLETGALRASGELIGITTKSKAVVDETVQIKAIFKNTGQKVTTAKFKGHVSLGDQIDELLESEELDIGIGDSVDFTTFFKPSETGRYVVSGRVYYDNKKTYEANAVINVGKRGLNYKLFFIYVALILVVVFLIYLIKREHKKR